MVLRDVMRRGRAVVEKRRRTWWLAELKMTARRCRKGVRQ